MEFPIEEIKQATERLEAFLAERKFDSAEFNAEVAKVEEALKPFIDSLPESPEFDSSALQSNDY